MDMPNQFELNPKASPCAAQVGKERSTVVLIEDLLQAPQRLIDYAHGASFGQDPTSTYPGVRAPLPDAYTRAVIEVLEPLLRAAYAIPASGTPRHVGFLSLIATPPAQLTPMQRLPHFDSQVRQFFAVTHYLNPGDFGGTGLFRHRPTGFESVSTDRFNDFCVAAATWTRMHGSPPAAYIAASTDHFELYHTIDYRPNRLVAYRGQLLHSGLIQSGRDISADPATGRLTANLFIEFA